MYRWNIAIKTSRIVGKDDTSMQQNSYRYKSCEDPIDEIELLLEEAKTMWAVGSYHENIVNLQGITVGVINASLQRVCCLF